MPEILIDYTLIGEALTKCAPDKIHDVRQLVVIYTEMADIAVEGESFARQRLPILEEKLRRMVPKTNIPVQLRAGM